jgi:hypothetical protein
VAKILDQEFLGFKQKESNYKYVQLEITCVTSQCKEIYFNEKSGKNIRSEICLFLGFREKKDNYT